MSKLNLFVPLTKVDVAKREVWGRAVQEVVDKVDEIFDYEKSKPHFEAWSKSFADATDGKSLGNIRAMHGKVAAGKAIAVNFNDTAKAIDIGAKIVDDNEWAKVQEGVYTGFSIGGSYVGDKVTEKVDGRDVKRYVAAPSEISIVDNPCIPTAKFFDIVKADGSVEKVAFKPSNPVIEVVGTDEEVATFAKVLNDSGLKLADAIVAVQGEAQKRAVAAMHGTLDKREFSTDERKAAAKEGAALPDGSFPIKTVADLENAVRALGRAKDKAAAKAHIIKRAKALGATDKLPAGWTDKSTPSGDVKKGLWNVSSFASCLDSLACVVRGAQYDLDTEGDDSPVPMKLRNAFADLVDCFKAMSAEEADEALSDLKTAAGVGPDDEIENVIEAAAKAGALRKRLDDPELPIVELAKIAEEKLTPEQRKAAKTLDELRAAIVKSLDKAMSAADKDRLQAAHDHLAAMGASCGGEKAKPAGDLTKALETIETLRKDVETLKKQPVPMVTLRTVKREEDGPRDVAKDLPDDLTSITLEPADYIRASDGSIDYFASRVNKAQKLAAKAAAA